MRSGLQGVIHPGAGVKRRLGRFARQGGYGFLRRRPGARHIQPEAPPYPGAQTRSTR